MSHPQLPSGSGPSRRRLLLPLLLVLLIAVPLAEVWLLLQVGSWIGLLPTVGVLVVLAVLGTWLSRREGSRAWKGVNQALNSGRMPTGEIADAALILIGAVLLVFPGFFTDIFGLIFLLPFTRPLAKRLFGWIIAGQAKNFTEGGMLPPLGAMGYPPRESPTPGEHGREHRTNPPPSGDGDVIPGEVIDDPDERS